MERWSTSGSVACSVRIILIGDWVANSGLEKAAQAQGTTIAMAASQIGGLVARPSQVQRGLYFLAEKHNFTFT